MPGLGVRGVEGADVVDLGRRAAGRRQPVEGEAARVAQMADLLAPLDVTVLGFDLQSPVEVARGVVG